MFWFMRHMLCPPLLWFAGSSIWLYSWECTENRWHLCVRYFFLVCTHIYFVTPFLVYLIRCPNCHESNLVQSLSAQPQTFKIMVRWNLQYSNILWSWSGQTISCCPCYRNYNERFVFLFQNIPYSFFSHISYSSKLHENNSLPFFSFKKSQPILAGTFSGKYF